MHGDRVAVRIEGARFRGRPQGTIVEVLERRTNEVVGRLHVEVGVAYLDAGQPAHHASRARAERRARRRRVGPGRPRRADAAARRAPAQPLGRVTRVLGDHGAPGMETDIAIHSHGLPFEFPRRGDRPRPKPTDARIPQDAIAGREDLRDDRTRHDRRRRRPRFRRRRLVRAHERGLEADRRDRRRRPLRAARHAARPVKRAIAAPRSISRIACCRCCPRRCRTGCVR